MHHQSHFLKSNPVTPTHPLIEKVYHCYDAEDVSLSSWYITNCRNATFQGSLRMIFNLVSEIPVPLDILSSWSRGSLQEYMRQETFNAAEAHQIWQSLVRSLNSPNLSEKQITSTCNCLRVFLKSTSSAGDLSVRNLPLLREEWMRCYEAICRSWNRAKIKPLTQVLDVLLQIAKNGMPAAELELMWKNISTELTSIILSGQPAGSLKRALVLSSFFLEKRLSYQIYLESVLHYMRQREIGNPNGHTIDADAQTSLAHAVISSFQRHDAQSSAEKCFRTLLKATAEQASYPQSWWPLVRSFVADHADSLDPIANSVFPILLEQLGDCYIATIHSQGARDTKTNLLFSLALLQSLREQDMIGQDYLLDFLQAMFWEAESGVPDAVVLLLTHADDSIRVRALRLLTTSKMTNAAISAPILLNLEPTIRLWFRPGGAHERGETLSIIRRLLIRLRGGASSLYKTASFSASDRQLLDVHKSFIQTLVDCVSDEISPNASYQGRIMGLTVFRYLLESRIDTCDRFPVEEAVVDGPADTDKGRSSCRVGRGSSDPVWPFSICLRQSTYVQMLLKLISDAFEDVRALSANILRHLLQAESRKSHSTSFSELLKAAILLWTSKLELQAAQTNRSDHADGLGRMYALVQLTRVKISPIIDFAGCQHNSVIAGLLSRLETTLKDVSNFDKPRREPLHGLLLGVMYCAGETHISDFQNQIFAICRQVWTAVADRLCVDSPETTDEDTDDFEELTAGPKDLLSYSWRALRDSSLLLRVLLSTSPSNHIQQRLLNYRQIGDLCMKQLTVLRHRGAFSTVAQTFLLCCQQIICIEGQGMVGVRFRWYQAAKAQVEQQADRLTRRSAGLPALMAGILSPDDSAAFEAFIDSFITMSQVEEIDKTGNDVTLFLPQVHAMNTLREVMMNSRFRAAVVPHLLKLLALATKNLGSRIWAIQNCGLMLYRACLLRLPSDDTGEMHDAEHLILGNPLPTALNLAFDLLQFDLLDKRNSDSETLPTSQAHVIESEVSMPGVEQKFAALDMIAHINSAGGLGHDLLARLVELLRSSIWLIRQRAAEVLALLTPQEDLLDVFGSFFITMQTSWQQNHLHGSLLYSRALLRRYFAISPGAIVSSSLAYLDQQLSLVLQRFSNAPCSTPLIAVLWDIINDTIEQSLKYKVPIGISLVESEALHPEIESFQGFYLADRCLLYNLVLCLLIEDYQGVKTDVLLSMLPNRFQKDPDVARYVLERLLGQGLSFRPEVLLQLDCLFRPQIPADVLSVAIDIVALSVEAYPSNWDTDAVNQMLDLLAPPAQTREVKASRMVTLSRLLCLTKPTTSHENNSQIRESGHHASWEQEVQNAARDETDTHLRLQAAEAISAYLPRLMQSSPSQSIPLLLTLHDLLNDDDEDVRFSAARTVSSFLSNNNFKWLPRPFVEGMCASIAAVELEHKLQSLISTQRIHSEALLRKLLNAGADGNMDAFYRESSVQEQLLLINNDAKALFAVERQNLYVNEMHEIRFWASLCRASNREDSVSFMKSTESTLGKWVVDGLGSLQGMLDTTEENPMIPGVTFDLDVLLLCVRVVEVAGVYLLLTRRKGGTGSKYQIITNQLQALKALASRRHFHAEVSRSINTSLGLIVR